jgi:hypothetical protein
VGAFNLSLILRKLLGAGTPRELKNRAGQVFSRLLRFLLGRTKTVWRIRLHLPAAGLRRDPWPPLPHTPVTNRNFGQFYHGLLGGPQPLLSGCTPRVATDPGTRRRADAWHSAL